MFKQSIIPASVVALFLSVSAQAQVPFYVQSLFTIADPKAVGEPHVLGMNNSDQVVGHYYNGSYTFGFVYSGGVYSDISVPGASNTWATGINNSGQIIGVSLTGTVYQAFLYSGGTYTALNLPYPVA